jgi:hypothetical protein
MMKKDSSGMADDPPSIPMDFTLLPIVLPPFGDENYFSNADLSLQLHQLHQLHQRGECLMRFKTWTGHPICYAKCR